MKTNIAWKIASLGQLSILLEVSSPKPGNVSRLRRFSDTGYRHFLASASLASRGLHIAASRGQELADGLITPDEQPVKQGELSDKLDFNPGAVYDHVGRNLKPSAGILEFKEGKAKAYILNR